MRPAVFRYVRRVSVCIKMSLSLLYHFYLTLRTNIYEGGQEKVEGWKMVPDYSPDIDSKSPC